MIHPQRVVVDAHAFAREVLHATTADRFYSTSKLFFAYALGNSLFAGLRVGATVILDRERATPERTREMVARHRPTLVFTVPTLYSKMLQENVAADLADAGIRHFVSAGEALPATVRSGWKRATGKAPISGYGTSETLCLALYCDDDSGLLHPTPLTLVRYADDIDPAIPQRISVRLPTLALGYWRRPDAQADGFRDGWFSPGDMFIRRDGRLEFAGRTDDLLKVSGQWVSTLWIEHALTEAGGDAIDQVAAVGVETPDGLTTIAALAVAVPGREDSGPRPHRRRHRETAEIPAPAMGALGHRIAADRDRQTAAQPPACGARVGAVRRRGTLTADRQGTARIRHRRLVSTCAARSPTDLTSRPPAPLPRHPLSRARPSIGTVASLAVLPAASRHSECRSRRVHVHP